MVPVPSRTCSSWGQSKQRCLRAATSRQKCISSTSATYSIVGRRALRASAVKKPFFMVPVPTRTCSSWGQSKQRCLRRGQKCISSTSATCSIVERTALRASAVKKAIFIVLEPTPIIARHGVNQNRDVWEQRPPDRNAFLQPLRPAVSSGGERCALLPPLPMSGRCQPQEDGRHHRVAGRRCCGSMTFMWIRIRGSMPLWLMAVLRIHHIRFGVDPDPDPRIHASD